jgi:hypothetical protein
LRGKGRGEGRGRGGGGGEGGVVTSAAPPLWILMAFLRRAGDVMLIWNIFLFSLSLSSLCVIYPRGRSVHKKNKKLQTYVVLSKNSLWHTLIKFKNRLIFSPLFYQKNIETEKHKSLNF